MRRTDCCLRLGSTTRMVLNITQQANSPEINRKKKTCTKGSLRPKVLHSSKKKWAKLKITELKSVQVADKPEKTINSNKEYKQPEDLTQQHRSKTGSKDQLINRTNIEIKIIRVKVNKSSKIPLNYE